MADKFSYDKTIWLDAYQLAGTLFPTRMPALPFPAPSRLTFSCRGLPRECPAPLKSWQALASLYRRNGHVLKPPGVLTRGRNLS